MNQEIKIKHQRLIEYMELNGFSGLILSLRPNFSWLTAGKLNYVNSATEVGVASLAVTKDKIFCVAGNNEELRMKEEELNNSGIEIISFSWLKRDKRQKLFKNIFSDGQIGFDVKVPGLTENTKSITSDFYQVRWALLPEEVERYVLAGKVASKAIEETINQIKTGMRETEIAGIAAKNILSRLARPWVVLIAADERISKYRHPIPSEKKVEKIIELIFCVEKFGLICSLTRLVSFGSIDPEIRKKHIAVTQIDGAVNLYSQPGRTLREMFDFICQQYNKVGYAEEWQLHHQGGPTGYTTRDCWALPGGQLKLVPNQALAWSPSITGTKSEDTIILSDKGPIVVTAASDNWPMLDVEFQGKKILRPDILVL